MSPQPREQNPPLASIADRPRSLRCALVCPVAWEVPALLSLATPGIEFVAFEGSALGIDAFPNPFALPPADFADVALVTSVGYAWLTTKYPGSAEAIWNRLNDLSTMVAGFDTVDQFALGFPPASFDRFALVLKANGVFRDRGFYNYEVGPLFPGHSRTEKIRPLAERYSHDALEKLRLSIPLFARDVPAVRRVMRRFDPTSKRHLRRSEMIVRDGLDVALNLGQSLLPISRRPRGVHCVGALSHLQRLQAMPLLRQFGGTQGISGVPKLIGGVSPPGGYPGLPGEISPEARAEITSEVAPFIRARQGRVGFMLDLARHKAALAPTGWGELTYRHGEVLRSGAVLVCESLDHVETQFTLRHNHNSIFFRPDLGDLVERIRELMSDEQHRRRIARTGRDEFAVWQAQWQLHLRRGVAEPLQASLRSA